MQVNLQASGKIHGGTQIYGMVYNASEYESLVRSTSILFGSGKNHINNICVKGMMLAISNAYAPTDSTKLDESFYSSSRKAKLELEKNPKSTLNRLKDSYENHI